jgi:hypothetical protein
MSEWLGRRTQPRIDYREAVRVIWPGEVSGVVARAVNLSAAGILIDAPTPTPCPVGSDVLCDLALPRGPRLLRGRVAHRRSLPEKVGMGIEFVDLSEGEIAELHDVVSVVARKPQRVKVRFEGTPQTVTARAFSVEGGLRLVTALPFLKPDTAVEIALSPDGSASARGRVVGLTLAAGPPGGAPRLLIDVGVDEEDPWRTSSGRTPVVEPLGLDEAVPEPVWDAEDVTPRSEPAQLHAPIEQIEQIEQIEIEEEVPTVVTAAAWPPVMPEPSEPTVADGDRTEVVDLAARSGRWRALGGGMIAGTIALAAFVAAIVLIKVVAPRTAAPPPSILPPVYVTAPVTPPPAAPVAAPAPAEAAPTVAAPEPAVAAAEPAVAAPEPVAAPAAGPAVFAVGLRGSLAGVRRYPLSKPDGVAFNLPHARATTPIGTYQPDVPGLHSVWVRALPGGGAHLRFYFTSSVPAPKVEIVGDEVRATAP